MRNWVRETKKDFNFFKNNLLMFLGEINQSIYLTSNQYIPKRMMKKVERFMRLILENGLDGFYWSFAGFLVRIRSPDQFNENDESVKTISFQNLQMAFVIYLSLITFSGFIFGLEILYFRFKQWWQQLQNDVQNIFPFQ